MQFPTSFPDTSSTPHTPICSEILYGLFVGDALGAQNEFKGRGHATQYLLVRNTRQLMGAIYLVAV